MSEIKIIDKIALHEACKHVKVFYAQYKKPEKLDFILDESLQMIEHIGKKYCKRFDQKFILSDLHREHYTKIIQYFFNDPAGSLNLTKGLFIIGPVGTGKTLTFKLIDQYFRSLKLKPPFKTMSCIRVMEEYTESGFISLNDYKDNTYYFDDLGVENPDTKHFGNNLNVMAHIVNRRYEFYENKGQNTHFTSNLGKNEIKKIYGLRVLDRLNKMCNWINLKGESFRK